MTEKLTNQDMIKAIVQRAIDEGCLWGHIRIKKPDIYDIYEYNKGQYAVTFWGNKDKKSVSRWERSLQQLLLDPAFMVAVYGDVPVEGVFIAPVPLFKSIGLNAYILAVSGKPYIEYLYNALPKEVNDES